MFIAEGKDKGDQFPKTKGKPLKLDYISPPELYLSDRIIKDWTYIFTKDDILYYPDD